MPLVALLVEGDLDSELLHAVLEGRPIVERRGSKNSLRPQALHEARSSGRVVGYLRDRDFDFDPPADVGTPTSEYHRPGQVIGLRWCRHEIENYLIDPAVVTTAVGWNEGEYRAALSTAAEKVRSYQISRWVVGKVRRSLPPNYELQTKPAVCQGHDFRLPDDVSESAATLWARQAISEFGVRVQSEFSATSVDSAFVYYSSKLSKKVIAVTANALVWLSGKDLLTALEPSLSAHGFQNAGAFRAQLRDWVRANPERFVRMMPEWQALIAQVRA